MNNMSGRGIVGNDIVQRSSNVDDCAHVVDQISTLIREYRYNNLAKEGDNKKSW